MTPAFFLLMLIGVGCVSWLLTRFLVWLDGADDCEEDIPEAAEGSGSDTVKERRGAA